MPVSYRDSFVRRLFLDVVSLIDGDHTNRASIEARLIDLAIANAPQLAPYWDRTERGRGVPDSAFRTGTTYLFDDEPPSRVFRTSGTTSTARGSAPYSALGLELMNRSICANARMHILRELNRPAIIRFVPPSSASPEMVMAYGMELIAETFGHPDLSASVVGPDGVDLQKLETLFDTCIQEEIPVVLIGGSFAFVNVCEALEQRRKRWRVPRRSRVIDAGGYKGRSRIVDTEELRYMVSRSFGVAPDQFTNLFGMTELASQLYDATDRPVGPRGERAKGPQAFIEPRVRDPRTMEIRHSGLGLLEVVDLCILDRPPIVLTGDFGIATEDGVAIVGRVERGQTRGCSLALEHFNPPAEAAHG